MNRNGTTHYPAERNSDAQGAQENERKSTKHRENEEEGKSAEESDAALMDTTFSDAFVSHIEFRCHRR